MQSVSVVIPVYNSHGSLPILIEQLREVLATSYKDYEVFLVNDGSQDESWDLIQEFMKKYLWLHGIDLMRNYGQHNALLCGIRQAQYEIIVTLDDDLQNPPEEIPLLTSKLIHEGCDVVYGTPREQQHGYLRDLASRITKIALKSVMGVKVAQNVSPFRAFRTELREAFSQYNGSFVSIDVLLSWGASRFSFQPVSHKGRAIGASNYTFSRLLRHALDMITGFSVLPLQIASFLGFGFTIFGAAILAYVFINFLIHGSAVPGFAFLASIIAIFSGAQLLAIGIIGEYLARMHFRTLGRPAYKVRRHSNESAK
ncbi:MAG: glycosyltransferase family 2 protein [Syntrophales bacterium]